MAIMNPPPERLVLEEASTADLVRDVLEETKELVRLEIEMTRAELKKELVRTKKAAIGLGFALGASLVAVCLLTVALVFALGATALIALAVAGVFFLIGIGAGIAGYAFLPKRPLELTRERLKDGVRQLKEHVA